MQIGMSASATRGGGLDRYFYNLIRELPKSGVKPYGFVAGNATDIPAGVSDVEVFGSLESSLLSRMAGVRKQASARLAECDIAVSHFAPYALPIIDRLGHRPLIVHFHGPWKLESLIEGDSAFKAMLKGLIEKIVISRGERFVVLSHAFAEILQDRYGAPANKIRIIPGGVELLRFADTVGRDKSRQRLDWPRDRRIVFSVRRLVHAKGLENLIEAADEVRKKIPDVLFMIAGTGPIREALSQQIEARGLEGHVRLCGFVSEDDLPAAYSAANLFVVPTIALEGFGLVVVESLACGTPTLVTPIGGLPEVVSGLDKKLVLAGLTPGDIAAGIVASLAPSDSWQPPTSDQCREYAKRFGWETIASRVADVYREVL